MSGKEGRRTKPSARDLQKALKILGHAIEHVSSGFMVAADPESKGRLEAILLLMKLNREIYEELQQNVEC